jgi:hypothetical protein
MDLWGPEPKSSGGARGRHVYKRVRYSVPEARTSVRYLKEGFLCPRVLKVGEYLSLWVGGS